MITANTRAELGIKSGISRDPRHWWSKVSMKISSALEPMFTSILASFKQLCSLNVAKTQPETGEWQHVRCRLLPGSHQADIRMRLHRLLRLDDYKLSTRLMQVDCQDFLSTNFMQVVSASLQISSCIESDFHRLDAT